MDVSDFFLLGEGEGGVEAPEGGGGSVFHCKAEEGGGGVSGQGGEGVCSRLENFGGGRG